MPDFTISQNSPLDKKSFTGTSGTVMRPAVMLTRYSLRINPENLSRAAGAFGATIPRTIGRIAQNGQSYAMCLGPDEWQLIIPDELANPLTKNFFHLQANIPHSLVDISHTYVGIELSGPLATRTICAGCTLDIENLPVGMCARTLLDKVQMIVIKQDKEHYRLEFVRSFAPFAWQFLENALAQYEAEIALNLAR